MIVGELCVDWVDWCVVVVVGVGWLVFVGLCCVCVGFVDEMMIDCCDFFCDLLC